MSPARATTGSAGGGAVVVAVGVGLVVVFDVAAVVAVVVFVAVAVVAVVVGVLVALVLVVLVLADAVGVVELDAADVEDGAVVDGAAVEVAVLDGTVVIGAVVVGAVVDAPEELPGLVGVDDPLAGSEGTGLVAELADTEVAPGAAVVAGGVAIAESEGAADVDADGGTVVGPVLSVTSSCGGFAVSRLSA
ncbi:MAG TPA: hypothetical protein VF612_11585 [Jatrophihabitans sp.]|jgi:hypothetical protein|uniref:hypothetical protein n=1 Tax=Jatrophihabitans sp. TaxID=1932789 RepID=UPI002F24655E